MAYPAVAAPYGLRPINLIGGQVFAGANRKIPIASGSATDIFYGDVVKLNANGTIDKDAGTNAATPVGVFLGCSFTDPIYGKTFRQYFPAGTVAADIEAFVCDDPNALFKVVVTSSGTTVGALTRAAVGANAVLTQNAGSTATGSSKVSIDDTAATTSTWPVRIVDVVPETASSAGNYTEVIVKWNAGMHQYNNPTGV